MRRIKGPLKTIFDDIQMEIDYLNAIIWVRYQIIEEITNNHALSLSYKAKLLSEHFNMLNFWKNQLKILKEKEIIISCA